MEFPKCRKCGKAMQPILIHVRPESSEWYCDPPCHTSEAMTAEQFAAITGTPLRKTA